MNDTEERERLGSTPHLPSISPGYATPNSDYNYEVLKHENQSNEAGQAQGKAVLIDPLTKTSTNYASSVLSDSSENVDKVNQLAENVGKMRTDSNSSQSSKESISQRKTVTNDSKRYSDSHYGSGVSQASSKRCRKANSLSANFVKETYGKIKQGSTKGSIRFQDQIDSDDSARRESLNSHKVYRSCTHAEGFGSHKNGSTSSFSSVDRQDRPSKSAKELGLTFDRDFTSPVIRSPKSSARYTNSQRADHEDGSHYRLSLVDSASIAARSSSDKADVSYTSKYNWDAPRISPELYQDIKQRLLREGKFKDQLRKYWGLDVNYQLNKPDSDDDGYDTDLDTALGLELIADEKSREVIEAGIYPEYKHNCRRFNSTPNSYFMRHSLDDNLRMRYRYLNKGDSIAISTQMKNHLTMSDIDLKDNGIGPISMNYFKHMLKENKILTELNLSCNNLGPQGAKHLKNALISNCFLLKLNISENSIGEKGSKYLARLIEENVSLKEINISSNNIGDYGATLISKTLEGNISLKLIDVSWNHIGRIGGVKLCDCLKKNTELEVFRAETNGFSDEGGKTLIETLKVNQILKEVDISNNRLTDAFIRSLRNNFSEIKGLAVLKIARNNFQPKPVFDLLATVMTSQTALTSLDIQGLHITDEFKGLSNAMGSVQDVSVSYSDPPSKREMATDELTRNLAVLCEFLEVHEIEIEDLYPDYEELEENSDEIPMVTIGDVITQLEQIGKVTRPEKIRRLKANLKLNSKRKFHISEMALVYDKVICGKDVFREKPLRSHLRRSIREERAEKARQAKQKQERRSLFSATSKKDKG